MLNSKEADAVLQDFVKSLIPVVDEQTHQSLLTMVETYVNKKSEGEGWSAIEELHKKTTENKSFNLQAEHDAYLEKVKLPRKIMSSVQLVEVERAFMAGCGSTLILMQSLGKLPEDKALEAITDMLNQVNLFWQKQDNG